MSAADQQGAGAVVGAAPVEDAVELERMRRWRMVLGGADDGTGVTLQGEDQRIDIALAAVYDLPPTHRGGKLRGGVGASAPGVARWLGDIRRFFPSPVVQVMQRDAIERLDLQRLLLEPEMLAAVEPDIHLVGTLLELSKLLPDTTRAVARNVVRMVVAEIESRLARRTKQAVSGAVSRAARTHRPRLADVDWNRTIHANLRNYLPEHRTVAVADIICRKFRLGRSADSRARDSASMLQTGVWACMSAPSA